MFHKIKNVSALQNYKLFVQFTEGVSKIYDVLPLIKNFDIFSELTSKEEFSSVTVDVNGYGVIWEDKIDISCNELFLNGKAYTLTRENIEYLIKELLVRFNAEYALLFGSYARGEETEESDIDVLVYGGKNFKKSNIFAFAEELRKMTGKNTDVFEYNEIDNTSQLYKNIIKEGIKISQN